MLIYHLDQIGSIRCVTKVDENGQSVIKWQGDYKPYGELLVDTSNENWTPLLTYALLETDRESGLIYAQQRWMDPETATVTEDDDEGMHKIVDDYNDKNGTDYTWEDIWENYNQQIKDHDIINPGDKIYFPGSEDDKKTSTDNAAKDDKKQDQPKSTKKESEKAYVDWFDACKELQNTSKVKLDNLMNSLKKIHYSGINLPGTMPVSKMLLEPRLMN
jgi:hypothetical protein